MIDTINEAAKRIAGGNITLPEAEKLIYDVLQKLEAKHLDKLASLEASVQEILGMENLSTHVQLKLKELRGDILEAITGKRALTCDTCQEECNFRGDYYNTNGDCLAVK